MPVAGYDVEVTDTIQKDSAPRCPGALELPLRRLCAILLAVFGFGILSFSWSKLFEVKLNKELPSYHSGQMGRLWFRHHEH